jgi:hypothetical protein
VFIAMRATACPGNGSDAQAGLPCPRLRSYEEPVPEETPT